MVAGWIRPFCRICAIYDFLLGLAFLLAYKPIFARFGVTLPNHPAYVQFAAAMVTVIGIGFWYVAQAPERNRDILKLGLLVKVAYVVIVFGYYFKGEMPGLWVPMGFVDFVMLIGIAAALRALPALRIVPGVATKGA
jgi:hypothetical protein